MGGSGDPNEVGEEREATMIRNMRNGINEYSYNFGHGPVQRRTLCSRRPGFRY